MLTDSASVVAVSAFYQLVQVLSFRTFVYDEKFGRFSIARTQFDFIEYD
jgi:hypothetical protein